eukprot:1209675-Rhodomonas_salina.1
MVLRACYAMSGTDVGYAATSSERSKCASAMPKPAWRTSNPRLRFGGGVRNRLQIARTKTEGKRARARERRLRLSGYWPLQKGWKDCGGTRSVYRAAKSTAFQGLVPNCTAQTVYVIFDLAVYLPTRSSITSQVLSYTYHASNTSA